jgi:hypothetical protein
MTLTTPEKHCSPTRHHNGYDALKRPLSISTRAATITRRVLQEKLRTAGDKDRGERSRPQFVLVVVLARLVPQPLKDGGGPKSGRRYNRPHIFYIPIVARVRYRGF